MQRVTIAALIICAAVAAGSVGYTAGDSQQPETRNVTETVTETEHVVVEKPVVVHSPEKRGKVKLSYSCEEGCELTIDTDNVPGVRKYIVTYEPDVMGYVRKERQQEMILAGHEETVETESKWANVHVLGYDGQVYDTTTLGTPQPPETGGLEVYRSEVYATMYIDIPQNSNVKYYDVTVGVNGTSYYSDRHYPGEYPDIDYPDSQINHTVTVTFDEHYFNGTTTTKVFHVVEDGETRTEPDRVVRSDTDD